MKALNVKNWSLGVLSVLRSHHLNVIVDLHFKVPFLHIIEEEVELMLLQNNENRWSQDVNSTDSKNGQGQNKLRTYRKFKLGITLNLMCKSSGRSIGRI